MRSAVTTHEETLDLVRALRQLDERHRQAVLFYFNHGTLESVAEHFDITNQGAHYVLRCAYKELRKYFNRNPQPGTQSNQTARAQMLAHQVAHKRTLALGQSGPPVFCVYEHCVERAKPVRSGTMHQLCRNACIRAAQLEARTAATSNRPTAARSP